MMESEEKDNRIRIHEHWMGWRRTYHRVKEGHRPKLTHEEVEEYIYQNIKKHIKKRDV